MKVKLWLMLFILLTFSASTFFIQQVKAWTGTIYIRADGSIDPPEARAVMETFDNITYALTGNITSNGDGIIVERNNIIIDGQGYTVEGVETDESKGICLVTCNNVTVKNVKVTKFTFGIHLHNSLSNNISENIFVGNRFGIYLISSLYNNIYGNIITNNYWGVWLEHSLNNTLLKNEVIKNDRHGITLLGSSNNTLQENNVMENGWDGINLETILNETSNNYILKNNLVKNGWCSIRISNSHYNCISGNNMESGYVLLSNSDYNEISRNNMANNVHGILLEYSSNNTILGNNITESSLCGVWLEHSPYNYIVENTFVGCGLEIYSSDLFFRDFHWSSGNTIKDNIVNGKPLVYLENTSNYTVKDAGQVILVNCSNILVENLNLSKASKGIQLWNTNNSIIANNIITNNWVCIDLCHSHNNTIIGNTISTNFGTQAINTELGIILEHSHYNQIIKNNITKCSYGILLDTSQNNFILGNNIENRIDFRESLGNSVIGNNIINTQISFCKYSSNNRFYHNNFIASKIVGNPSQNLWDDGYPCGGNYWSNYTGTDADSDGIGDAPYVIGPKCVDRYPLLGPISIFDACVLDGSAYTVDIASNSSVSSFKVDTFQKTVSFNVAGLEETYGFCRITIPNIIVQELWQDNFMVLLNGEPCPFRNWTDTTNTYIYINYTHSTQQITIIPEFPSATILLLFMILFIITVVFAKKKFS